MINELKVFFSLFFNVLNKDGATTIIITAKTTIIPIISINVNPFFILSPIIIV